MRVVVVDGDIAYPPTSGKRLRTLHFMLRLAARHEITYVARPVSRRPDLAEATAWFKEQGIEAILLDDPVPRKSGIGFYARLSWNVLSRLPYSVASHWSRTMADALARVARERPPDLWQFEWSPYLDMLDRSVPGARLVIAHNVDTLIWQRYFEHAQGWARREYIRRQWRKFDRFERRVFHDADQVVAVSPEDARLVRDWFAQPRVEVVENGVDSEHFAGVQGEHDSRRILFLGALDWRPNLDGVAVLLDRIFPAVLAQEPHARLSIVGRHPPASLAQRISAMPGVELHADVPDVRPFLGQCGVMTVPLRIGGGSRLKILESLAAGLPVVSTRVGAEGLELQPGEHYVQAEEADMAAALVQAIRQPDAMRAQADKGRELVRRKYDWSVLADKLEAIWRNVTGDNVTR